MKRVTLEEKMAIKDLLASKRTFSQIAKELALSKAVVRKWGRVIKKGGELAPQMGRPKIGPLGTFSKELIAKIDEYRPGKEGWGSDTIKVELDLDKKLAGLKKPSPMSINRYLKSKNRIAKRSKHAPLQTEPIVLTKKPHDLWQLDAEGNCHIENVGFVAMLNIKETHCKVYIQNFPCLLAGAFNHATTIDYQNVLRLSMMEFGTPKGLQVDHESIYYDNVNPSPFPTTFHLWLIGLRIEMHLTPKGKPYKQGAVERSHQTFQKQVVKGCSFKNWKKLFVRCQQRRKRLNYHIPCSTLNKTPPLIANPKAASSGRSYHPAREEELFASKRIYTYLAKGKWYRKVSTGKVCWVGARKYHLPNAIPNTETMITFDKKTKNFLFYDAGNNLIDQKPALGLTFKELSGNIKEFLNSINKYPYTKYP